MPQVLVLWIGFYQCPDHRPSRGAFLRTRIITPKLPRFPGQFARHWTTHPGAGRWSPSKGQMGRLFMLCMARGSGRLRRRRPRQRHTIRRVPSIHRLRNRGRGSSRGIAMDRHWCISSGITDTCVRSLRWSWSSTPVTLILCTRISCVSRSSADGYHGFHAP
jgi:hypothetical protein